MKPYEFHHDENRTHVILLLIQETKKKIETISRILSRNWEKFLRFLHMCVRIHIVFLPLHRPHTHTNSFVIYFTILFCQNVGRPKPFFMLKHSHAACQPLLQIALNGVQAFQIRILYAHICARFCWHTPIAVIHIYIVRIGSK